MTDHTAAIAEKLGFSIDPPDDLPRRVCYPDGSCHPASDEECALWDALAQPQQPAGWQRSDTSRLRKLLEKATPGPWSAIGSAGYVQAGSGHPKHTILAVAYGHGGNHQINAPGSRENGEYIAACNPEAIRALLDELDAWRDAHPSQQEDDVRNTALLAEWMACESRRPLVVNSLRKRAAEMRAAEKRCRNAFRKDFMGKPSAYVADAFADAATAFETRLAAITAAQGDAVQGGGNG